MALNRLIVGAIGSTDWTGGRSPAGGTHTGRSVIVMADGTQYLVAHSRAEVLQKLGVGAVAQASPHWICFDIPNATIPAVLNSDNIQNVIPQ